jgi:branched-chain amino acid transport system substrate-binding protein
MLQVPIRMSLSEDQNMPMAATIAAEMKAKTWITIAPYYEFGHQWWEFFQKYSKTRKPVLSFSSTAEAAFAQTETTHFSLYISKVVNAKPEGVFVSLWGAT